MAPTSLSKSELPALTNQALEANLIQISTTLLARGWMLATAESCTGGTADKPVGTVWFGWNVNGNITTATRRFDGDRAAVRLQTLAWACARLNALLQTPPPAPR